MKEIQDIISAFEQSQRHDQRAALATVVYTSGSVYRRPGARMLITESGQRTGSISGGCLENDVCERAQTVIESRTPVLVVYDAIANGDLLWGLGLGCNGVVKILIEPLHSRFHNPLTFIAECIEQRQFGVLATVFQTEELQTPVGSHLRLNANGVVTHTLQDVCFMKQIAADAQTTLHLQQSSHKQYASSIGRIEVWLELIQPSTPLIIFGAGHDAVPVAQFAKALDWYVTVVDRRPAYVTRDRFPMADQIIIACSEHGLSELRLNSRTAAVVMTHNYFDDRELLKILLPSPVAYLGLLGPKYRTKQLLEDLQVNGLVTSSNQHLYAPIGLDIGAETPEAIALAIVAEIQAVLAKRAGGMLRDRKAPIHAQSEAPVCVPLV